jgi:outer membrane protein, heavy metal efflux system
MASGLHPVASAAPHSTGDRRMPLIVFVCVLLAVALPWPARAQGLSSSDATGAETPPASAMPPLTRETLPEPAALSLRDALALALRGNPDLAAFSLEVRAAEAAVPQAGVLPNPVLEIGGDNLGNARKTEAGDRTMSIQIGQLIELGGKRAARTRLAETDRDLANWDYEARRIDILSRVAQRFVDVLFSQSRNALAAESVRLARQVADVVAKRVQAGKVSHLEETKARLALASADVELEQARRELVSARQALGALWGEPNPHFQKAAGDLDQMAPLPGYQRLTERVRDNPELVRWATEIARRQAGVDAERAKAIPDVTVTAGVARFSEFDDHAYMVGIAIPLPVFDRNRGGVLEANRRLDKADDERRAAEARLLTELAQTYQRLAAIDNEIETLRMTLLPGAQSAFDAATKGYQLGKFGFLEVLDAQRTLFQTRSQHLRALADYRRGVSEIERLIGGPLEAQTAPTNLQ